MKYWIGFLSLFVVFGSVSFGQVTISIKPNKKSYLAGEAVIAEITLTNNTGREVEMKRIDNLPWLDILVTESRTEAPLTQIRFPDFPKVVIPAGKQVSRKVDLRHLYVLQKIGYYKMQAIVRTSGLGNNMYGSKKILFDVQNGRTVATRTVSNALGGRVTYVLCTLVNDNKQSLYVQVKDDSNNIIGATVLAPWLTGYNPIIKTDANSCLHVFFQTTPKYFVYASVSPEGKRMDAQYYGRMPGAVPRLVNGADGSVSVSGAYRFDPKEYKETKARSATELPEAARKQLKGE